MTSMQRSNLVHQLWPYLPAFRAVADAGRLGPAAEQLHVVPSALSRSIRILEERLGGAVFERRSGRLVLNARGRALLESVREGMRAIERGAAATSDDVPAGDLPVATLGVLTHHVVLPVLLDLARARPGVVPVLRNLRPAEANHRLVLGDVEVAFYYDAVPLDGVSCARLGALTASVYCGPGHPLRDAPRVTRKMLLAHPFSVPSIGDRGVPMDGWPVELERKVGFRIELLVTNLEVCRSGRFLTVLPDVVAAPHVASGELRRFAFDEFPPIEVYGACRQGEQHRTVIASLFDAVRSRLGELPARR
jgi:DNA-binding transcriptional LysR family regulator